MATSPTKAIAEMLGTPDKTKQVEIIEQLVTLANNPPLAVTVHFTASGVDVTINSPVRVGTQEVKRVLQLGVDKLTALEVQQKLKEQEEQQAEQLLAGAPHGPFDEPYTDSGGNADTPVDET